MVGNDDVSCNPVSYSLSLGTAILYFLMVSCRFKVDYYAQRK